MKTTDPRDPLDKTINALLSSRPLKADKAFTERVLQATNPDTARATKPPIYFATKFLHYALPAAAAIAFAITCVHLRAPDSPNHPEPQLSASDIQEIFLLEESLASLPQATSFDSDGLMSTLDALYFDIES